MATLRLKDVSKSINEHKIVQNINLDVGNGEFIVLVGPSGCGKTTILRLIAGLEQATSGEIYIEDKLVNNKPPKERDIAMVFQSYALYPHMTVKENLAFGLKMRKHKTADIEARVKESAQMLGLEKLMERYPKQLSGGQRQRVAMGRAMVRHPKVFLFDEPLSNLDAALRSQMRVELRKLHKRLKPTMVYVTHDQVEAMTLADRIVVINQGVIQHIGTPEHLYFRPANTFVAGFIGSPAMNFVNGKIVIQDKDKVPKVMVENHVMSFQVERLWEDVKHDQPVVVGVRPHDVALANGTTTNIMKMTTEVMEPLGWESLVHGKLGKTQFVAQISNDASKKVKIDETINVTVGAGAIHLFKPDTGMSLLK